MQTILSNYLGKRRHLHHVLIPSISLHVVEGGRMLPFACYV